jgi:hypothetical protein
MQNFIGVKNNITLFFQVRIRLIISTVNVDEIVMLITVNLHFVGYQRIQSQNITSAVPDNLCIGIAVNQQMGH